MDAESTVRQIDDLTVDLARRKVYDRERKEIVLSALSFDTLRALIDAAPAALSADEIIERAWRGAIVSDDAVTQRIRLLRTNGNSTAISTYGAPTLTRACGTAGTSISISKIF